jgi:hypothetical protein
MLCITTVGFFTLRLSAKPYKLRPVWRYLSSDGTLFFTIFVQGLELDPKWRTNPKYRVQIS